MVDSRNKGATFERKIAKILTEGLGYGFSRTPQSGAFATNTKDSRLAGDVYSPDKLDFPFVIECKKYKEYNLEDFLTGTKSGVQKWYNQLIKEKGKFKGILIFQRNYGKIMCMVEGVEFEPSFYYNGFYIGLLDNAIPEIKKSL